MLLIREYVEARCEPGYFSFFLLHKGRSFRGSKSCRGSGDHNFHSNVNLNHVNWGTTTTSSELCERICHSGIRHSDRGFGWATLRTSEGVQITYLTSFDLIYSDLISSVNRLRCDRSQPWRTGSLLSSQRTRVRMK